MNQIVWIYIQCLWTIYKKQKRTQKFKEKGGSRYIYQNELDRACFQHNMTYGDFKDLTRRTVSDKILRDYPKNPKYDGQMDFNTELPQWFIIL